jgi:DNA-binding SARP family transcriptional activator
VERLIDLLWGLDADTDRLHSLRTCLWDARKVVPPEYLVTDELGYRLRFDPRRDHADVDRFRRLHREGRDALSAQRNRVSARLLEEAVRLRGSGRPVDLLPATPAMTSLVTGLAEEHRDARSALFEARLALGRHRELLPELRTLVTAEPEDEQLWGHILLALYRCGLRADALRAFAQARDALRMHAGVEPGTSLRTLLRRIQADDPALRSDFGSAPPTGLHGMIDDPGREVVPCQLPADLRDFTGRTEQAAELIGLLSPSVRGTAVPVVQLTGPPGVGKTALAVHVGHAVAHDYPDGQLYVRLAGGSPRPPGAGVILGEVLRTFGIAALTIPETTQQRASAYRSRLAGLRVLIVLDDAASAEQVRPLIPGTAGSAVIVTSRGRLAGLPASGSVTLAPLEHADARRLLGRITGRPRLEAEAEATAQVVDACGGLPLAIRIAAERLNGRPVWPVAHLARALADERHRLDELAAGGLAIRTSIATSYQALNPQAQRLFRHLALASGHSLAAWIADVLMDTAATELISILVDRSLLTAEGLDDLAQPRFRFHDLLREYAAELCAADTAADGALDRLLSAWIELADVADAAVPRALYVPITFRLPVRATVCGEPVRVLAAADPHVWFAAERPSLLATIDAACAAGKYRRARELALRTAAYLHLQSYHEDAERMWIAVGDAAEKAGDIAFAARAWLRAAMVMAADRGHHGRAVPVIDRCIAVFTSAGDRRRLSRAYGVRGYCARAGDRLRQARSDGERSVELAREGADAHAEFFGLRMLAVTLIRLGDYREGVRCCERALGIAGDLDADTYRCAGLYTLAKARLLAGQPNQVIDLCTEGLTLTAETERELVRAHFHQQMGLAYQQLRRNGDAISALSTAIADFASRHDRYQAASCLRALADSYQAVGRHEEAIGHLQESIIAFQTLGVGDQEAEVKMALAEYRSAQTGDTREDQ